MTPQRPHLLFALCLTFLIASTASAQEWQGGAAFGVRVTDEHGDAISGAQIVARISDVDTVGPPAGETDASGRAVVSGLREGEWFVEVSHAGYMLYSAYVSLRAGKKPIVGFSSQVNTATSWVPMTVKFQKATADFSRRAATRKRAAPRPPTVVREQTPEPPSVARAEPKPPEVVRPEAAPEPEPEASPEPAQETSEPEVTPQPPPLAPETMVTEPEAPAVEMEELTPPAIDPVEAMQEAPIPPAVEVEAAPIEMEELTPPAIDPVEAMQETPTPPPVAVEAPAVEMEELTPPAIDPVEVMQETPIPPPVAVEEAPVEPELPATDMRQPETPVQPPDEEPAIAEPKITAAVAAVTAVETQQVQEPDIPEPATPEVSPPPVAAPEAVPEIEPSPAEPEIVAPAEASPVNPAPTEETVAKDEDRAPSAAAAPATAEERVTRPDIEPTELEGSTPIATGPLPRFLRSAAAGSCSECDPGEWAIAAEQEAARMSDVVSRSECNAAYLQQVSDAAQLLADTPSERLDDYAGPVLTAMFRVDGEARDLLQDLLGSVTDPESNCQMAGVVLPRGASFTGYVLEAWDSLGGRTCRAGLDCAVGRARWLEDPQVVEGAERVVVFDVFKNRSSRRERRLRMTVYFTPADPAWVPRTR